MKKIVNLMLIDTNNYGDRSSSPLDYFGFDCEAIRMDVTSYHSKIEELKECFIIYGGGGHIHIPAPDYNDGRFGHIEEIIKLSPWMVTWGLGHNVPGLDELLYPPYFKTAFKLNGMRNKSDEYRWVPCSSCMSPLFDEPRDKPTSAYVIYHHDNRLIDIGNFKKKSLNKTSMRAALKFIQKGRTLITNSFHGAYWGLLLGKKVVVISPLTTKFKSIHPDLVFATEHNWRGVAKSAKADINFLDECRNSNIKYHKDVNSLVEEYKRA